MKQIFTFLLSIGFASTMQAQQPATVPFNTPSATKIDAAPAITVIQAENMLSLTEAVFDFGKIPQGKPVTHVFEVTNKSNIPLKISDIHASCGCTTPEWEKDKSIAPGEQTKITVGYNAAAEGPFTKFITVSYNDTQSKQITITGEVWKTPGSPAPENKGVNDLKN